MILNLLSNAIKFQTKGIIMVKASVDVKEDSLDDNALMLVVSVRDKGIGMTKNEAKNLFKPFFRTLNIES